MNEAERAPRETLTAQEQRSRRDYFRRRLAQDVEFNRFCGLDFPVWSTDMVRVVLPFAEVLTSSGGWIHGGVVSALIDTGGAAAVLAGHDFSCGSSLVTVTLSVQYLSAAREEDLVAEATCSRRGRTMSFAQVVVTGATSGRPVASGQGAYCVAGERPGVPWV